MAVREYVYELSKGHISINLTKYWTQQIQQEPLTVMLMRSGQLIPKSCVQYPRTATPRQK